MSRYLSLMVALLMVAVASTVHAQGPWSLELRGGPAFPTADLNDASLGTGAGFGVAASYRFLPHLGAYAGWDWHRLGLDEPFLGGDYDVEDTGYAFGLQFQHPMIRSIEGWVRAGGIFNHIEMEDDAGTIVDDSGHELGWEVGGGLSFPLGRHFALTPGARYRTFSTTIEIDDAQVPVDLSYLTAEVGLSWTFGARTLSAVRAR